ncbi:MAG: hypothetical protein KF782_24855 [Labilithrix sp.]|nr:hypothetical protein [Labilithrix sp.]
MNDEKLTRLGRLMTMLLLCGPINGCVADVDDLEEVENSQSAASRRVEFERLKDNCEGEVRFPRTWEGTTQPYDTAASLPRGDSTFHYIDVEQKHGRIRWWCDMNNFDYKKGSINHYSNGSLFTRNQSRCKNPTGYVRVSRGKGERLYIDCLPKSGEGRGDGVHETVSTKDK